MGSGSGGGGWDPDQRLGTSRMAECRLPIPQRTPWRQEPTRWEVCSGLCSGDPSNPAALRDAPAPTRGRLAPRLYPEALAVLGEADLLQPRLDLGLLPAGHAGQNAPRHLLAQQAQCALGQRRCGAVCGVGNEAFQALDSANVAEHLWRSEESTSRAHQLTSCSQTCSVSPTRFISLLRIPPRPNLP